MMNWSPIFITITILLASSTTTIAEEPTGALFPWPTIPTFTNHNHGSGNFIKRVQCGASIHNVYSCLRSSFLKFPLLATIHQHSLLPSAVDCCTTITDFRTRCGDLGIGKLESFIFPALLFKQCSTSEPPAPASAPDAQAADVEV
ncbi:hypothetical protein HanIR_Chr03g0131291 [Helianthus annuus]|nr:hypothetical protein HanIR_Chr03g0131291 [Helianthus annuus]